MFKMNWVIFIVSSFFFFFVGSVEFCLKFVFGLILTVCGLLLVFPLFYVDHSGTDSDIPPVSHLSLLGMG